MGRDEAKSANESRWTELMLLCARPTDHFQWQLVAVSDVKCWQVPDVLLRYIESNIGIKVNDEAEKCRHDQELTKARKEFGSRMTKSNQGLHGIRLANATAIHFVGLVGPSCESAGLKDALTWWVARALNPAPWD